MIFELDYVLRYIKPYRFLTLFSASFYNTAYLIAMIEAYLFLYEADQDKKSYTLFSLVEFCILIFNLATNIATYIINWCLIMKEFTMEFFQLLQENSKGVQITDVSLGLKDAFQTALDVLWMLNPINWAITAYDFFFQPHNDWQPYMTNPMEDMPADW